MTHGDYPGPFLNAHCHLELGGMRGVIPPGLSFPEWLERLAPLRRKLSLESVRESIKDGLRELREGGTEAVIDVDSLGIAPGVFAETGVTAISLTELLKIDPRLAENTLVSALHRQKALSGVQYGLTPHAPYTTSPPLLRMAAEHSRQHNQWMMIHVAEFPEETEMTLKGSGALVDFLRAFNVLPPDWAPPGLRPVEYLSELGVLGPKVILAHLNEVTDSDLKLIAESGAKAVVCPGTHVYFNRGAFPLARLLKAGIPTYLGTDSLASNERLSMAREIELAIELTPEVPPDEIAALASMNRWRDFSGDD